MFVFGPKIWLLLFVPMFGGLFVCANNVVRQPRTVRASLRMLGLGPWCVGCPKHFCDDDLNIIQGYCCGCARLTDYLPVNCPSTLRCPTNSYQLCTRYEYMMHCCC